MKATTEFWQKNLAEIHRALVRDCGCTTKITRHRDANGDYDRIETFYATLRAELVDRDLELAVDVTNEPEKGRLDGLSISAFRGFRDAAKGEDNAFAFAVFENGRALRVLHWKTPLVSDPAERTARELLYQRIKGAAATVPPPVEGAKPSRKSGKRGPKPAPIQVKQKEEAILKRWEKRRDASRANNSRSMTLAEGAKLEGYPSARQFKACLGRVRARQNAKALAKERRQREMALA